VGVETEKTVSVWQSTESLWSATETPIPESVASIDVKVVLSTQKDDKPEKQEKRGLSGVGASHIKLKKLPPLKKTFQKFEERGKITDMRELKYHVLDIFSSLFSVRDANI